MIVYLAILQDRHADDDIRVFAKLEAALQQVDIWKIDYPHVTDYEFENHEPSELRDGRCLDVWQADEEQEEGLVMSIEEKEVHGYG